MTAIVDTSYTKTFDYVMNDIVHLPCALANSTDVVDKFCKFALQAFACNSEVTKEFKAATTLFSTFGISSTLAPMVQLKGDFWLDRNKTPLSKLASKVVLVAAQTIDLVKGLDTLKLVSLGTVSSALGRVSAFSWVMKVSPPLNVAKDSLIVVSTAFSIISNWNEGDRLRNKSTLNMSVKEHSRHEKAIHTNRIALIADVFKCAIVGLMVGVALSSTVTLSSVLLTTSFGVIKLGTVVNGIGLISATTGLVKALHGSHK